jgi:hypothetical protein
MGRVKVACRLRAPSAAKACTEEKGFIAALKRCATQNHCFSANCKAGVDFSAFTTRLKAAPFQNKIKTRVFSQV